MTDSTPVQALGFNIVDIFDHGQAGSFQDYIAVSVNGTTLFTLSDGLAIASGQTGPVTLSAPGADGGAFGTTILQGQQVATFIGVVHNAGGTVNNFQISYDYNGPRINPVTGLPFNGGADAHGVDEMVEVTPRPIVPSNDAPASINGATGGNTNIGVLNGDTLNGDPATLTTVEITDPVAADYTDAVTGDPVTGLTLNPATGLVAVAAGTPAGTYEVAYEICEVLNAGNCASAVMTVVVDAAPITAANDAPASINGATGGNTDIGVLNGDTLNGDPATLTTVEITDPVAADYTDAVTGDPVTGLTLNPATGLVAVAAGTPAGTYAVAYEICEVLNAGNCASAVMTVVVDAAPITAANDAPASINGATGGNTDIGVLNGDTLNGDPATLTTVEITDPVAADYTDAVTGDPVTGLTLDPATGLVAVAAGTPAGTYEVAYEICEVLNAGNCASAVMTVVVDAAPITAANDAPASINGATGGNTDIGVLNGDTLNGDPATLTTVEITDPVAADYTDAVTGDPVTGLTLNPATGLVAVAAGTPAGTYEVAYEICEVLNAGNCASAVMTVVVDAAPITAANDAPASINGATGGNTNIGVLNGDTLNGDPATLTTVEITDPVAADYTDAVTGDPVTGLTLDPATGLVAVAAGTPAGTYAVAYEICEVLNAGNCASAVMTVVVDAAPITAANDAPASINGATGGNTNIGVLNGDTLNGDPATLTTVEITDPVAADYTDAVTGDPVTGLTLDPATGLVAVAAGTPAGTYEVAYEICEALNAGNCASAVMTVVVDAAPITAANDAPASINGATGGNTNIGVLNGDTLNGDPATLTTVEITDPVAADYTDAVTGDPVTGLTLDPATGLVAVAAGTPAGTYEVAYEICEVLNAGNCASAVMTVVVDAAPITAANDAPASINGATGGNTNIGVLNGDTLNGDPATLTTVEITDPVAADYTDAVTGDPVTGLTLDPATGLVAVAAGTPAGTYEVAYEICEVLNAGNCASAVMTVVVDAAPITAANDAPASINGATGGNTDIGVLNGDTLNGDPATLTTVEITDPVAADYTDAVTGDPVTGLTLDPATGLVAVAAGTPAGTYAVAYEICEVLNAGNCASAVMTVVVDAAPITAANDAPASINGATGGNTNIGVLNGDTLNGDPATLTTVEITDPVAADYTDAVTGDPVTGLTLDPATGLVAVAAGTPAGTYEVAYEICEALNAGNCASAVMTVVVDAPPITAANDAPASINGATGGNTNIGVLNGDTLNGDPATLTTVEITDPVAADYTDAVTGDPVTGLTLDPATGLVAVAAGTPAGTYEVAYEICEVLNAGNCASAVMTVVVDAAPITAANDAPASINGATGGNTNIGVLNGDTLNGDPATLTTVEITDPVAADYTDAVTGDPVTGLTLDPATGLVAVAAGTPAGTYAVAYEICEVLNAGNCASAVMTVVVDAAPITAANDAPASINGATGGNTNIGVLNGDTLNGDPATLTTVEITDPVAADYTDAVTGDPVTGLTLDPATGLVAVAAGTPAGTYEVAYEICEALNAGNCASAVMTVVVDAPPLATDDTVTPTRPGPVTIDVLVNDNGTNSLDPATVTLTGTGAPEGATLSADGKTLTVPGEGEWTVNRSTGAVTFTPAAGFSGEPTPAGYVVSDVLGRTSNEAFLRVAIIPALEIVANDDGPIMLNGIAGATSDVSLLDNDTLDGLTITDPTLVVLTVLDNPEPADGAISVNAQGQIVVAAGTTPGTYTVRYQICEVANPTNCAVAEASIAVLESDSLIAEIEDDLTTILEDDLAATLTMQSRQISGYSADAVDRLRQRSHDSCLADANERLSVENILFDTDRAIIKPASAQTLDEIAGILATCPQSAFEIAGHTDSDASDAYNLDLSQRRVEAVLRALAVRGIATEGYSARGYGESEPIATNATAEGKAQNRRVEFRPLSLEPDYHGPCDTGSEQARNFDLTANEDGVQGDGSFLRDQHNCFTDRREVFEGTLSFSDYADGLSQTAINLSYRREQYQGADSVFGYFAGLYGTQTEVSSLAVGDIRGVGINGGIYGAKRLKDELFVDYYLAAATGRHSFDLDFDRTAGTIIATGDYRYLAGFTGAALSGELDWGENVVTPRVGFDYVYTSGADVDVVADLNGLSQAGSFDLDSLSGGRIFAEVRTDRLIDNGQSNLWITPRVACYQALGDLDGTCGIGGSIGIESAAETGDFTPAIELDGEWVDDYFLGSLSMKASRELGIGTLSGDSGVDSDGTVTMGANYEIGF
ncbi:OmpA family protein [Loktanella sp. R86503]|uniref:OmpA family protein n=1 Tax=Loktanella sp. R86503 TaxID=3093847 RepID=UPI0036DD6D26